MNKRPDRIFLHEANLDRNGHLDWSPVRYWQSDIEYVRADKAMAIFRQATPKDFTIGKVVYIEGDDGNLHKMKIDVVLRPNDQWKAFCADDGCRYGLEGCFIKDEE